MKNFDPRKSIREYVNEQQLAFELMKLKYLKQLTNLRELGKDEVETRYKKEIDKRVRKYTNKINGGTLTDIGVDAFKKNIETIKKDLPPSSEELIKDKFEIEKEIYLKYITGVLEDPDIAKKKYNDTLLEKEYLENVTLDNTDKEKFGHILLLVIKNLGAKPSFSGYTSNWKDDFMGNAIEKVILYVYNFDRRMLSKRTGKESKAFAYLTQICFNAFIAVINERKKSEATIANMIPYEKIDGYEYKHQCDETKDKKQENLVEEYVYEVNYDVEGLEGDLITDFSAFVNFQIQYVLKQNEIKSKMDIIKDDLNKCYNEPDEVKATVDYISYVRDLESKYTPSEFSTIINKILVVIPKTLPLMPQDIVSISAKAHKVGLMLDTKRA